MEDANKWKMIKIIKSSQSLERPISLVFLSFQSGLTNLQSANLSMAYFMN